MSKIECSLTKKWLDRRTLHSIPLTNKLQHRAVVGLKKYGVSLEDEVQPLHIWYNHSIEEGLDMANYLEKIISVTDNSDNTTLNILNNIQIKVMEITAELEHIRQFYITQ